VPGWQWIYRRIFGLTTGNAARTKGKLQKADFTHSPKFFAAAVAHITFATA
jgi:hypothetical protein